MFSFVCFWFPEGGGQGLELFVTPLSLHSLSPGERDLLTPPPPSLSTIRPPAAPPRAGSPLLPTFGSLLTPSSVPVPSADLLWAPPGLAPLVCLRLLTLTASLLPLVDVLGGQFTAGCPQGGPWAQSRCQQCPEPGSVAFPTGWLPNKGYLPDRGQRASSELEMIQNSQL